MDQMSGSPVQVEMGAHYRCYQCERPVWREGGTLVAYAHWQTHHQFDPAMANYEIQTRPVVAYSPRGEE